MPADETPLASPGESALVKRVSDHDPALLRYLSQIGLVPETQVSIIDYSAFDGNLTLKVKGQSTSLVLGTAVTKQIFVEA
jgi:DtxR family Mn-dependent transcriptional regulator